jgi:hypothetical protein
MAKIANHSRDSEKDFINLVLWQRVKNSSLLKLIFLKCLGSSAQMFKLS